MPLQAERARIIQKMLTAKAGWCIDRTTQPRRLGCGIAKMWKGYGRRRKRVMVIDCH